MEKLLTPKDVSALLGVSASWVREHSNENGPRPRIPGVRIGDRWRYSEAAIERWLKELGIDRGATK